MKSKVIFKGSKIKDFGVFIYTDENGKEWQYRAYNAVEFDMYIESFKREGLEVEITY